MFLDGGRHSQRMTSMRRPLVFALLGPASVVFTVLAIDGGGSPLDGIAALIAMLLFLFTLSVSAIAGPIDGYLARTLPLELRAPLTALTGGTIAVGLLLALNRMMFPHGTTLPLEILMPFAVGGAVCMGACSLLSHDYGRRQRPAVQSGRLPSSAG
jgi:hypothetical protein